MNHMKLELCIGLLILVILISGCIQQNKLDECTGISIYECKDPCAICTPSLESSVLLCHSKEFCGDNCLKPTDKNCSSYKDCEYVSDKYGVCMGGSQRCLIPCSEEDTQFNRNVTKESFGIYLLEENKLIVSEKDIISYNKTSHVIKLTSEGYNKFGELFEHKKHFVVRLDGKDTYNGTLWSGVSSEGVLDVVIVGGDFSIDTSCENCIKIRGSYPSISYPGDHDPRNNSEIFNYFEEIGKLVE